LLCIFSASHNIIKFLRNGYLFSTWKRW